MTLALAMTTALAQPAAPDKFGLMKKRIEAPMVTGRRTFTQALRDGAIAMRSHYLTFGIELADGDYPEERMVISSPPPGGTVGEFLQDLFRQVPTYEYEVVSEHAVSVYPRGAKEDPNDILNLRIPRFDVDGEDAGVVLVFPQQFIAELRAKLAPPTQGQDQLFMYIGPVSPGPKVTLHLRDVTVREILNAVTVATENPKGDGPDDSPCSWIYRTRTHTGEVKPNWGTLFSLPPNWKELVHPARVSQ
jgi:hypothetical protein